MALDDMGLGIGREVVKHAARAWLEVRREQAERDVDLTGLIAVAVVDKFRRRDLARQLEAIGDQVAWRLQPLYDKEFRRVPEHEREAALATVLDALRAADLSDHALFAADVDPARLAREIRHRLPRGALLSVDGAALFNLVLDQCCVALVHIVQGLPAFEPRAVSELLSRTTQLSEQIGQVLDRLPRTWLTAPQGTEHDAEFRRSYLQLVSETLDELELFGIDVHRYRPRTRVTVAYISLTVTGDNAPETRRHDEDRWFTGRRGADRGAMRAETALTGHRRMLVRGEAGSGKTTLLQWLAVNSARGGFTGALAEWNGRVPFLVRLRSYADRPMPKPDQFLDDVADLDAGLMPVAWVHRQLEDQALLLVDGVDEFVPQQRRKVRLWLHLIVTRFPDLPIVVTSRPTAATPSWLDDLGFGSVLLEPMGPHDITAFVGRWHDAIRDAARHDAAALPCPPGELAQYESAMLRHLDARRHLRTLATSPLLCAMLCALNLDRRQHLPPDRMALYDAALNMLLERRDSEREVPAAAQVRLDARSKIAILQHLAWRLTLAGRAELALDDATEHVGRALARLPDVDTDARAVVDFLVERSGVIRTPVDGRVDFVHRTFQEYLAAKEATDDHLVEVLVDRAHSDQWRETVVMAAGHATPKHRQALLTGILDRAEREPRHARRLRLLAAACLETAHTVEPTVTARIDAALDAVIPPRGERETRSLALAGDRALRKLPQSLDGLTEAAAAASVRTAALINGEQALRLLAGYAADPRRLVQKELAAVWAYFDPEEYAKTVLADAPLDNGKITVTRADHVPYTANVEKLDQLRIQILGDAPEDLTFLAQAHNLTQLVVNLVPGTIDLAPLEEHPRLWQVVLHGGTVAIFNPLTRLPALTDLWLELADQVDSIEFVTLLPTLQTLRLRNLERITDLLPITALTELTDLDLEQSTIDPTSLLNSMPRLNWLRLRDLPRFTSLAGIRPILPQLDALFLQELEHLSSIAPLQAASRLKNLMIWRCPVADLSPLAALPSLIDVVLTDTPVADVSPLAGLPELRHLDLRLCRPELDLTPLARLPRRTEIWLAPGQQAHGQDAIKRRHRIRRLHLY